MKDANTARRIGVGCRLDPIMHAAATARAKSLKRSMNNYINLLIERDLNSGKVPMVIAHVADAAFPESTDDEIPRAAEHPAVYTAPTRS